jgi:hypothetical protein
MRPPAWLVRPKCNLAPEERAGREDHGSRFERAPVGQIQSGHPPAAEAKRSGLPFHHLQALLGAEHAVDRRPVEPAVGLHPRPAYGGALAGVEHPVVDPRFVGRTADPPVEGVNLSNQMALAQPADRRIARHRSDLIA